MSNGQDVPARSQEDLPSDAPEPKRQLTKSEVQEQLRRRRASIDGHLEGVQQDLKAGGEQAQRGAERLVKRHTLAVLGGLGLAGAAVGYALVRRRRTKREAAARSWVDEYRDAVREEVRAAARRGEDPGAAAGRILEGHRPLVVREEGRNGGESQGLLRTVLDLVGRTLVSVAVKYAVDAASGSMLPTQQEARDGDDAGDDAVTAASAVWSQE
ncbi:MAG: hypothetical protein BRD40_02475 [Bacteroidetes bacterium QS_1_65_9]|nr:MAG: hypothetical protein BRD40_02475 [Bacteroidetes bacterium QS_1_65_9]